MKEEAANALTHGVGFLLSLIGFGYLAWFYWRAPGLDVAGAVVFGTALTMTYGSSMLYHAVSPGAAKRWFRRFDHASIFILIAGTYTPFGLGVLEPAWGLPVFAVLWGVAVAGAVSKVVDVDGLPWSNHWTYLTVGWTGVVVLYPLATTLPLTAFLCIVAGGLAYSAGTVFYARDGLPYNHAVWHLFVLAGSGFHYASVVMAIG